ncbi:MAG: PilN domain-containing protein [Planctomycetota bacterium]
MTDGRHKDIVEEVFSKSTKADDRVSSLFTHLNHSPQIPPGKGETGPGNLKGPPAAKEAEREFASERTVKNKKLARSFGIIAVGAIFVSAFGVGNYLSRHGNVSAKMMQAQQPAISSETVSPSPPPQAQPLVDVQPEPAVGEAPPTKRIKKLPALDQRPVIDVGLLLDQISATIPKTVQLSVLESGDGSQMFLEGRALSADALHDFVDRLGTNSQIQSAELTQTRIGKWKSQELLKFSISCRLASQTKTPANVDGVYGNSGFDSSRLFTTAGAEEFFGKTQQIFERAGCIVESFLVSPKDAVFEDIETNSRITKKHAVLTALGGYQNILKAVSQLQNRPQSVWVDSLSIHEGGGSGKLECSLGISVYAANGAD